MCLSAVYVMENKKRSVIVEEASLVQIDHEGAVEFDTLFGEKKLLRGYRIVEVNFLKNYILLEKVE